MSQRIAIKSIVTKPTKKEGTNITTIEDEKGAKMSAFNDTALAQLHAGDILEVELAVEGQYTNIKSWKLIESKPAPPAPPAPAHPVYPLYTPPGTRAPSTLTWTIWTAPSLN